jgi:hypothetical protein
MNKILDWLDNFFWTTFKYGWWIFTFIAGLIVGTYVLENYL